MNSYSSWIHIHAWNKCSMCTCAHRCSVSVIRMHECMHVCLSVSVFACMHVCIWMRMMLITCCYSYFLCGVKSRWGLVSDNKWINLIVSPCQVSLFWVPWWLLCWWPLSMTTRRRSSSVSALQTKKTNIFYLYRVRGECFSHSRTHPRIPLPPPQKKNTHAHTHTFIHIHVDVYCCYICCFLCHRHI